LDLVLLGQRCQLLTFLFLLVNLFTIMLQLALTKFLSVYQRAVDVQRFGLCHEDVLSAG
jgi:hypothetical protein